MYLQGFWTYFLNVLGRFFGSWECFFGACLVECQVSYGWKELGFLGGEFSSCFWRCSQAARVSTARNLSKG